MWDKIVILCLFILFCVAWMNYKKNKLEPFSSGNTPKDVVTKIKNMNTEIEDILSTTSYRNSYEEMILEVETWANNSMLNILAQGKIGVESVDKTIDSIRMFNDLHTFKKNLNDTMSVLDKST